MDKTKRPKKPAFKDWTAAYIVYRLKLKGWTLSSLSKHHGYASRSTMRRAVATPWPKGQRLIAEAIGVAPNRIWPSRYPLEDGIADSAGSQANAPASAGLSGLQS